MKVLVIDNYDSFVYNLVQYVGEVTKSSGGEVVVRRNDAVTLSDIDALNPDAVVVSPGPGTPEDAGVSLPLFRERAYPTLGVCLGHQALCAANGAPVGHAESVVHGKPSTIMHDEQGIFATLRSEFDVGRYHSLAVERSSLPDCLIETAQTTDEAGVVMGVRHEHQPHVGVQFHPESILTDVGLALIRNFLAQYVPEVAVQTVANPDIKPTPESEQDG
ncbi:anthranilate synthase component II [Halovenus rubra]|uniref:Anthranilate synthase component II n=2 Tax=Halovenus rubra TaxID=869890 RepID=A0ACC7E2D7_9EURY|nr:aminodeoxychorismate/anthranilate synthase component II [Halovenus rubra]